MSFSKTADILIIGGGIIGLTLAGSLRKKGVEKIIIIEKNYTCGAEASSAAAGMLAPQSEANCADDFFRFCSQSRDLYPNFAAELFEETGVDVELDQSGTLYLAFSENDSKEIGERFEWQKKVDFPVEFLSAQDARKVEPFISPDVREALFFPNDWQVENRKLLGALEKFAELNGIEIFVGSEVKKLLLRKGTFVEDSKVLGAETSEGQFFADTIVLATGAWTSLINNFTVADSEHIIGGLPTIRPIRGQMICFKPKNRLFSKVIYSPRGYIVPRGDGRILAGATVEDVGFDKSVTQSGVEFLRRNSTEISPILANLEIYDKWSGLRPRTADGLPKFGTLSASYKNLFLATAHYRNGILLAPLTAKILADKIVDDVDSEYLEIFSTHRYYKRKP